MAYALVFSPEAEAQLADIFRYVAVRASPDTAERYVSAIIAYCDSLRHFPHRGTRRDDIRPGLRITNYRGQAVIVFSVDDANTLVSIIGVFYGGQNYEGALRPVSGDGD